MVEQAVDVYAAAFDDREAHVIALDILLRELARFTVLEPNLSAFIAQIERYIDSLHRDLAD